MYKDLTLREPDCLPCGAYCRTCTSSTICTTCEDGYEKEN